MMNNVAVQTNERVFALNYDHAKKSTHLRLVRNTLRVLLIEDDIAAAKTLTHFLTAYNPAFQVRVVCDPYEASLLLTDSTFDLVLVNQDLQGLKASKILKQVDALIRIDPLSNERNNFHVALPVVMMSETEKGVRTLYNEKYQNFKVIKKTTKSDLLKFLSENFTN